ncbi:MAG: hypothetical protein ACYDIC_19805, partial [Desulfobaccales bacterium]
MTNKPTPKKTRPIKKSEKLRQSLPELEVLKNGCRGEEAMQHAYDALEQSIAERTTELTAANALLKQEIEERKRAEAELKRTK